MDTDEIAPPPAKPKGPNFEAMGVAELEAHIAALEAEIERARAAIAGKQAHRGAVDAFFRR